jgi:putative sigma-54 modulation protein
LEIKISAKNLTIDEDIRGYAEKKIAKLTRYLTNITTMHMELSEEKSKSRLSSYVVQVTLNINGFLLRGVQKDDNLKSAIDAVTDVMERLIEKYKKRYAVNKSKVHESIRTTKEEAGVAAEISRPVIRRKRFALKPMSAEQAIEQMDFLSHDFFLFINDGDSAINVVYRRKDGNYGLIQPEIG